jgi:hypothetical protein
MAGKTTTHETTVLNILRATNVTAPANVYVGLYTAVPSDAGGGTEVPASASYARQLCGFSAPAGTPRSVTNAADILFPVQAVAYGLTSWFGIFDALTAGNLLYWAALTVAKTFAIGDQAVFRAAQLSVQED